MRQPVRRLARLVAALLLSQSWCQAQVTARARPLAVAWNDPGTGRGALAAMSTVLPWPLVTPPLVIGRDARGYLVYSTDLLLSSHLHQFTLAGDIGPELHVSLDYFAPALEVEPRAGLLFVPDGTDGRMGINVFDAATGARLTPAPTATTGPPSDLVLLRQRLRRCS
jgi:hypothetical protein